MWVVGEKRTLARNRKRVPSDHHVGSDWTGLDAVWVASDTKLGHWIVIVTLDEQCGNGEDEHGGVRSRKKPKRPLLSRC